MRTTFSVQFYCRSSKSNKQGLSPIEVSIVLNGERSFIQLPIKEKPEVFNRKRRPSYLNELVDEWRIKIIEAQTAILRENQPLTIPAIKEYLQTGGIKSYTLSQLRKDFLKHQSAKWTNNELTYGVYRKYERETQLVIDTFGDIQSNAITPSMAEQIGMKIRSAYKPATARSVWTRVSTMFNFGVREGKIQKNPLEAYKVPRAKEMVTTITDEEMKRIEDKDFGIERLQKVADAFLFSAGTGLAYADLVQLTPDDVVEKEGRLTIFKERQKTGVKYYSVLTPMAERIYRKYDGDLTQLKISNQRCNSYLKEIQDICNITSVPSLHFHLSRHYYATYLLSQGLPITTVSKCLGHSSLTMTQHYAKVLETTILSDFKRI